MIIGDRVRGVDCIFRSATPNERNYQTVTTRKNAEKKPYRYINTK
jgi:hypothetical protein